MKLIKAVIATSLIVACAVVSYGFWFYQSPADSSLSAKKIPYVVNRDARPKEIARDLESLGIINNRTAFFVIGKITKAFGTVRAAEYELSPAMAPKQIFKIIQSGIGIHRELLVREGENIYQVAATFEAMDLGKKEMILKLMKNSEVIKAFALGHEASSGEIRSLEGYLLPNTYYFEKKDHAVVVLKRMVDAFLKNWTPEFEARARELGLTRYQVVTLASMIEKETGAIAERPIISSVFHNRLQKKMRLQSDPTTIYGIWDRYTGNIKKIDLQTPTEYNTYTRAALPVGPISNPSTDAIHAALYPEQTEYLYFVSKNDGSHLFSKNYDDHRSAVNKFQIQPNRAPRKN